MDVPKRPGDALAQPTRARLFALLGDLRRPAPTEELAERLGLHPNGVRTHPERLHAEGLLSRRGAPPPPRPPAGGGAGAARPRAPPRRAPARLVEDPRGRPAGRRPADRLRAA